MSRAVLDTEVASVWRVRGVDRHQWRVPIRLVPDLNPTGLGGLATGADSGYARSDGALRESSGRTSGGCKGGLEMTQGRGQRRNRPPVAAPITRRRPAQAGAGAGAGLVSGDSSAAGRAQPLGTSVLDACRSQSTRPRW